MVKFRVSHSEFQTGENLGAMHDQGQFYNVALLRVKGMENFYVGVKNLRTQHFDTDWDQK